jgi:hypothetical protein
MPFNGSGGTSQPTNSVYPASANTLIESAKFNISIADIYTMLASCIVKDGQTATTAAIPFASGIKTDDINENSAGEGVTIDSALIKDGRIDTTQGADIASATTVNLETATGNVVDITGSTGPIGTITLSQGHWRIVRFVSTPTLTNSASLVLPGGADITAAAGDYALFIGYASSVVRCAMYVRASGEAVVHSIPGAAGSLFVGSSASAQAAVSAAYMPINCSLAASVAANALTIAIKGRDGNDPSSTNPVLIPFRNATAATGDFSWLVLTAALSITVPDTATLGTANDDMARLYVYAVNDGGTGRLGVYNPVSGSGSSVALKALNVADVVSSTQIGTGSDSAQTLYTNGGAATSKAACWLGFVEIVQATAGTWATAPALVVNALPGVPYTGAVLQVVNDIEETGDTTTSSTLADVSGASASITPASRCNLLECHVDYSQVCANQTSTSAGSTAVPVDGSGTQYRSPKNMKGTDTASELIIQASGSFHFYAKPDSTSAQTVKLQHSSINNSDTITTRDVGIMVKEVFA